MYLIHNKKTLTYINYQPIYKGINITEIGEETSDCNFHRKSFCYRHNYIVHFVTDGSGKFYCDGKIFQLSPGKAFVITPHNWIRYSADEGVSWSYCWIAFSGTDCDTLFQQCGFSDETAVFDFRPEDIAPLKNLLTTLRNDTWTDTPSFALSVISVCFEVLRNCAAKMPVDKWKKQTSSSSIVDTAVAYMQANLHRQLNISQICHTLGISRAYFSTLFENTLKQPPYQYLQNLRIQRACELLLSDKHIRICEVSEAVGFSSTSQFCKTFRKVMNYSPLEFRQKYTKL